ncbi:hypothetical protein QUA71_06940 [Microcoleus sp. MON1_C5]|uniref:hypothetical protein n=1 Tax=Microcoleus sp. MON1_C5 TaxID=2818828 RepID=UPI002FD5633F
MPDYFHSALRGEQIHEAKIKILVEGSPMPTPEWEGQFVAVGKNLYYSVKRNNVLTWIQPTAYNTPQLPNNVVIFESGYENPPTSRDRSGIVYQNIQTKDLWYSEGVNWIKLGKNEGTSTLTIISGRSAQNWQGNLFGLLNPTVSIEENCLLITKMAPQTKYYFAIQTPTMLDLGGSDDNLFYVWIQDSFNFHKISTHSENTKTVVEINTALLSNEYIVPRLGIGLKRNSTNLFLNFEFNLDSRYFNVKQLANISYGY